MLFRVRPTSTGYSGSKRKQIIDKQKAIPVIQLKHATICIIGDIKIKNYPCILISFGPSFDTVLKGLKLEEYLYERSR